MPVPRIVRTPALVASVVLVGCTFDTSGANTPQATLGSEGGKIALNVGLLRYLARLE